MRVPKNRKTRGVFEPSQVEDMRRELKRGETPNETPFEREERAAEIIRRELSRSDDDRRDPPTPGRRERARRAPPAGSLVNDRLHGGR